METLTVGRQLYYWLNRAQCQVGFCSQIESERSDQGTSSGHLHDRHLGNPGADSALNESCLEHTCAGLHSEKGSCCLTTHLSILNSKSHVLEAANALYKQVRGLSVPNPYHDKLERSSLGSAIQNVHCPPALRITLSTLYRRHSAL